MTKTGFIEYVASFYGTGGIYPMGATEKQIAAATEVLLARGDNVEFDSIDREKVRDIMITNFGLKFPENQRRKK